MRMTHVVALIHEASGAYGIAFPDFPGCVSGGASLDEAVERGTATLAFHVAGMIEDGDALPRIRSLSELRSDPDFVTDAAGAILAAVPLEAAGKSVRVNISLDERLLGAIYRAAEAAGKTRSSFLAEAARSRLRGAA
jgi:predicted RNase H-like HicB family nuclease